MLELLAVDEDKPLCLFLDNLESLQEIETLAATDAEGDEFWFVKTVLGLPNNVRVICTGRYRFSELESYRLEPIQLDSVPLGDILRRMYGLQWPSDWDFDRKRSVYEKLGGNHRALEWMCQLVKGEASTAPELLQAIEAAEYDEKLEELAEHQAEIVIQSMRENLLLDRLLKSLPAEHLELLQFASLARKPVLMDALLKFMPKKGCFETARDLIANSLLESGVQSLFGLEYFFVSQLVSEGVDWADEEKLTLCHQVLGEYFAYQGRKVTRLWSDDIEAVHHYHLAGEHENADELAGPVSSFLYGNANYAAVVTLLAPLVKRAHPPAPFSITNNFGLSKHVLGNLEEALLAFESALEAGLDNNQLGTCLNNISQIYKVRGDYDTALKYLQQSLLIQQEIGDKKGEGTTLNNLATTAHAKGDYDTALKNLQQSLLIQQEMGDKQGEGATLNNISQIYDAKGDYDTALKYLQQSLLIRTRNWRQKRRRNHSQ